MKSDKPRWAKQQHSREAIHWLIPEIAVIGDMVARVPKLTVACGYALDRTGHAKRTTKVTPDITCWVCAKMARDKGLKIHEEKADDR